MQANYLSHFLIFKQLMEAVNAATNPHIVLVGSVTGNDNTTNGGVVYPVANFHKLAGFKAEFETLIASFNEHQWRNISIKNWVGPKLLIK